MPAPRQRVNTEAATAPQDQQLPTAPELSEGQAPLSTLDQNARIAERFMSRTEELEGGEVELDDANAFLQARRQAERSATENERELIAAQLRKDKEREAEVHAALAEGRKPVASDVVSANVMMDESLPLDRDGTFAVAPESHTRWVRMTDGSRPTDARAHQFRRQGYKPVLSKVDGKPIVGPLGLLMETTRELEAKRRAEHARPVTSLDELEQTLDEQAARATRESGLRPGSMKTFRTGSHNAGVE